MSVLTRRRPAAGVTRPPARPVSVPAPRAAEDADVSIVEIGETPPDGKAFWTYYDEVTDSLGKL